ncbi:hypothetical protein [Spirillospora albida]|uniref:hypothetical protein n=1 Tax=Spirillospora albida TaxID=58123 RepID=UPI00146FFF69|nr:hypothetical protein [Spirillospora albida]
MSQTPNDPAGTTHQFENFVRQGQPEKSGGANIGLIVGIAAVAAVAAVVIVGLIMVMG